MTTTPSIRREVRVAASPERAFEAFTVDIGAWWPVGDHSVHSGSVAFEGNDLIERTGDVRVVWAEVTEWNPPHSLSLSWHPGSEPATATVVRVTFTADGDETLVTLIHSGWEKRPDPEGSAADYGEGWIGVLAQYAAAVNEEGSRP